MGPQKIEYPTLLADEPIDLLGYPVEAVIAEKVETMISRGDANTRERDYADVLALSKIHPVIARRLRRALEQTAAHRGTRLMPLAQALDTLLTARQREWRRFLPAPTLPPCPRASRRRLPRSRTSLTPCSATIRTSSAGTPPQGSGRGENELTSVLQPGRHAPVRNGRPPHRGNDGTLRNTCKRAYLTDEAGQGRIPWHARGRSSVGRAPPLHGGGQGFESPRLHS